MSLPALGRVGLPVVAVAVVVAGTLSACDPEPTTMAFPMPTTFVSPHDAGRTATAEPCPAAAERAQDLEPETRDWVFQFEVALRLSAARTLIDNPDLAAPPTGDNPTEADFANPWALDEDVVDMLTDDEWWAQVCVDEFDEDAYKDFADAVLQDANRNIEFASDVRAMYEPAIAGYDDLR